MLDTHGPHEIDAPLGAGGMGEVYLATDTRLGREVAVKVLPGHPCPRSLRYDKLGHLIHGRGTQQLGGERRERIGLDRYFDHRRGGRGRRRVRDSN